MPLPIYTPTVNDKIFSINSIIAIAAGKGGVGKSTVTVNLARSLASKGYRVGVLDADVYGPSLRRMLPEDRLPSQKGEIITPALSMGIKYISMAHFRKDNEAAVVRAPIANGVIQQFLSGIAWGELDYLLIDFPPGTGDIQLTLAQKAFLSGAVLVTTPQEISVMDVRKAAKMFDIVKVPILGVVENMSFLSTGGAPLYPFGKGGGERLGRELGVPLLAQIPVDGEISLSGDRGEPLPRGTAVQGEFDTLATKIMDQLKSVRDGSGEALRLISLKYDSGNVLEVEWNNGRKYWGAVTLQENCPCANCVDETTGKRRIKAKGSTSGTRIESVNRVGRYAIQIKFSEGCSTGIYDFDYLSTIPTINRKEAS